MKNILPTVVIVALVAANIFFIIQRQQAAKTVEDAKAALQTIPNSTRFYVGDRDGNLLVYCTDPKAADLTVEKQLDRAVILSCSAVPKIRLSEAQ